jgi:lysophospholipase L1-like esterase
MFRLSIKWQLSFFIFLFLLILTSCGNNVPPLSPLPSDAVILAFGDSLTFGTGASKKESYPEVLSQLIQRRVINAGVPGEKTTEGLARLPAILQQHQPKLLLLCHGGNDFLQRTSEQQTIDNLKKMIQFAKDQQIEVVLIGVPQPGLFLSAADFYQEIAHSFNIPYEKEILSNLLSDNNLKSDQIHPNSIGYRKLAEAIAQLLRQATAIGEIYE